ncbi:RsmB/NOP family class I SAM-dependent RNA methyltransferase [Thermithiobacillus plumbiphilus]|uniref:RsmB/NOP family class I SAM-dependent RNA methyltransferase n=1 Tax=Thermithiobacillus plumbiphilus TaxID=1729899 RepID=A0ABU9D3S6_9PROT
MSRQFTPSQDLLDFAARYFGARAGEYLACAGQPTQTLIRVNTHRIRVEALISRLAKRGITLHPSGMDPALFSYTPAGANPGGLLEHAMGLFYLQDLSSFAPVRVLDPQPGERVLDMCAAPGSKTTQISQAMQDQGVLLANDVSLGRVRALAFNLDRLGSINVTQSQFDGERLGRLLPDSFDRVLLDAPCSALGIIGSQPEVMNWWNQGEVVRLVRVQEKLFHSAVKALRPGGRLVYSTCTLTPAENELRVDWALKNLPLELEALPELPGLVIEPGWTEVDGLRLDDRVAGCARVFPPDNAAQGFFIAAFRKKAGQGIAIARPRPNPLRPTMRLLSADAPEIRDILHRMETEYGLPMGQLNNYRYVLDKDLWIVSPDQCKEIARIGQRSGIRMARLHPDGRFSKVTSVFLQWASPWVRKRRVDLPDSAAIVQQLLDAGEIPYSGAEKGQVAIFHEGICLGLGFVQNDRLISRIPDSRRNMVRIA